MFHGAMQAILDYKTWLLLGIIYGLVSAVTIVNFFPTVVKGLGKGNIETLLLTSPPYLIGALLLLINAWHADKTGALSLHCGTTADRTGIFYPGPVNIEFRTSLHCHVSNVRRNLSGICRSAGLYLERHPSTCIKASRHPRSDQLPQQRSAHLCTFSFIRTKLVRDTR